MRNGGILIGKFLTKLSYKERNVQEFRYRYFLGIWIKYILKLIDLKHGTTLKIYKLAYSL